MNELKLMTSVMMAMQEALEEYCIGICGRCVDFITALVHGVLSWAIGVVPKEFLIGKDMYEEELIRSILEYGNIIVNIGIVVLAIVAMWQIAKTFYSLAGLNGEIEEPWKIGIKIMIFAILVVNSYAICRFIIVGPVDKLVNMVIDIETKVEDGNIKKVIKTGSDLSRSQKLYMADGFMMDFCDIMGTGLTVSVVKMVIVILVDYKILKFVLTLVQKYINMVIYILISPIAFACGVSKATNFVLKGWLSLFLGGIAVQLLQIAMLKILNTYYVIAFTSSKFNWSSLFVYFSSVLAMTKLEELLAELGLSGGVQLKFSIGENFKKIAGRAINVAIKLL